MFIKFHREGFEALPISLQQQLLGQPLLGMEALRRGRAGPSDLCQPLSPYQWEGTPTDRGTWRRGGNLLTINRKG